MRTVALGLALAISTTAQRKFEVASVKPSAPDVVITSMNGGPLARGPFNNSGANPERIVWTNVRLIRVLQVAYGFFADRISGPDWIAGNGYDISAIIPPNTSEADFKLMLQKLLVERFKLVAHRATKEVSGYALQIGKGGAKIAKSPAVPAEEILPDDSKPSPKREGALQYMAGRTESFNALVSIDEYGFAVPRPGNPAFLPGASFSVTIVVNGRSRGTALNMTMPSIADFLGTALGSPVQDETSLTGTYDARIEYVPPSADPEPGPDIRDAIERQLGLKLVSKKVPVETLVVDYVEKTPVGN